MPRVENYLIVSKDIGVDIPLNVIQKLNMIVYDNLDGSCEVLKDRYFGATGKHLHTTPAQFINRTNAKLKAPAQPTPYTGTVIPDMMTPAAFISQ